MPIHIYKPMRIFHRQTRRTFDKGSVRFIVCITMFSQRRNFFVPVLAIACIVVAASALETGKIRNTIHKFSLPEVREYVRTLAHQHMQNARKTYHDARNYMTKVRTNIGQEGGLRQSLGVHPRPRIGTRVLPPGFYPNGPQDAKGN